jgi:hypothetical protein
MDENGRRLTRRIQTAPPGPARLKRRGRYNVQRLMAEHRNAKLTDLLPTLADRPKAREDSVHRRSKAVYEALQR